MDLRAHQIEDFLARCPQSVLVEVVVAKGSTPRAAGACMLVAAQDFIGTIGGGQLEFLAIDHARKLLKSQAETRLEIPLGPGIGQCCGGHVTLDFTSLDKGLAADLKAKAEAQETRMTGVYLFGGGHVGQALARALGHLPFRVQVIDTRADMLKGLPQRVTGRVLAMPEAAVRAARPGDVFVAVTHDHALDFLVTGEALRRGDAAYVGMIGSKTKRAQFCRWFLSEGGDAAALDRLICPIGGGKVGDKRPEIIAALTAAEIIGKIAARGQDATGETVAQGSVDGG